MGGPPGLVDGKYRSCPHITIPVVHLALFQLQKLKLEKCGIELTHCCIQCGLRGKMNSNSFRSHFGVDSHSFALRSTDPVELYCVKCNDYQYCSFLDKKTGRKRTILGLSALNEQGNQVNKMPRANDPPPKGLLNMGATCFMNSVLQILCRTQALIQSEQLVNHPSNCPISNMGTFEPSPMCALESQDLHACIPCEFKVVCDNLHNPELREAVIIPSHLLYAIWNFVDYMAGYAQQDAHEFLIAFLNSLDHQLNIPNDTENLFKEVFSGEVQSNLTCTNCGSVSATKEIFVDLSLSVDIDRGYQHVSIEKLIEEESVSTDDRNTETEEIILDDVDLSNCLQHFTALEEIKEKLYCEKCQSYQKKSKQLSIVTFPDMVIFHLKRFNFLDQKKITNKVNFPVHAFNLLPFMTKNRVGCRVSGISFQVLSSYILASPLDTEQCELYDLQGVVCHEGTLHQGHYISYVKDFVTELWLRCDDDDVAIVDEEKVKNAEAYLLFYTRQKKSS